MTKEKRAVLHRVTGFASGIMSIIAGLCLGGACVYIFLSGDGSFSREIVVLTFGYIQIPVYIALGIIAVGFVLDMFFPLEEKEELTGDQPEMVLDRLRYRRDPSLSQDEDVQKGLRRIRTKASVLKAITYAIVLCCIIFYTVLIFKTGLLDRGDNTSASITKNVLDGLLLLLPFLAVCLGLLITADRIKLSLIKKETELLNSVPPKKGKKDRTEDEQKERNKNISFAVIRVAIIFGAIALIIGGYLLGGYSDVLAKAVAICTECIGLG